jgi:hypothetical protein
VSDERYAVESQQRILRVMLALSGMNSQASRLASSPRASSCLARRSPRTSPICESPASPKRSPDRPVAPLAEAHPVRRCLPVRRRAGRTQARRDEAALHAHAGVSPAYLITVRATRRIPDHRGAVHRHPASRTRTASRRGPGLRDPAPHRVLRPSDALVRLHHVISTVNPSSTAKTNMPERPNSNPLPHRPLLSTSTRRHRRSWVAALRARAKHLAVVDKKFGDIVEYQRDRVVSEAEVLHQPRQRIVLRGGQAPAAAEGARGARRVHQGARSHRRGRIAPRKAHERRRALRRHEGAERLPRTKLFELTVLDDEELAELDKGGTAAGLTFDDVDRMGVRELRAALRKEREARTDDNEANERLIANKDKKINQLTKKSFTCRGTSAWRVHRRAHTCSLGASEVRSRASSRWPRHAPRCEARKRRRDAPAGGARVRIINDVNLLVQRVGAIQGFTYENFLQYVDNGRHAADGRSETESEGRRAHREFSRQARRRRGHKG